MHRDKGGEMKEKEVRQKVMGFDTQLSEANMRE